MGSARDDDWNKYCAICIIDPNWDMDDSDTFANTMINGTLVCAVHTREALRKLTNWE